MRRGWRSPGLTGEEGRNSTTHDTLPCSHQHLLTHSQGLVPENTWPSAPQTSMLSLKPECQLPREAQRHQQTQLALPTPSPAPRRQGQLRSCCLLGPSRDPRGRTLHSCLPRNPATWCLVPAPREQTGCRPEGDQREALLAPGSVSAADGVTLEGVPIPLHLSGSEGVVLGPAASPRLTRNANSRAPPQTL